MKKIYFDMDGTLANFYQGEWLEDLLNENARPYAIASKLIEEETLIELVNKGYDLNIISWLSKNGSKEFCKQIRQVKKQWLAENYPKIKFTEIHIVKYGTPKHRVANEIGILVDDEKPNRDNWLGIAIEPSEILDL